MALLDFSRAFDCVWKEDPLFKAVDRGLPITFTKWLLDFVSNRQVRVHINEKQDWPKPLGQGLPQESALSSLLFLLYISDPKAAVPNDVEVPMFANDVFLCCSHPCKLATQAAIQEAVTRVA